MDQRRTISPARSAGLLAVTVVWALFLTMIGSPEAILFTVPVFLLAAPLAIGRYPGERLIATLRSKSASHGLAGFLSDGIEPAEAMPKRPAFDRGFGRAPPAPAV